MNESTAVQGSGWGWLGYNTKTGKKLKCRLSREKTTFNNMVLISDIPALPANMSGRIEVATCANQDPLQPTTGLVPLVGIDVWEHAYYVDYRNVR